MTPEEVFSKLTLWPLGLALVAIGVFLFLVYTMNTKHAQWSRYDKPRRQPRTRLGRRFRRSALGRFLSKKDSDRTRYWVSLTISWTLAWFCFVYSGLFMYDWAIAMDNKTSYSQDDSPVLTVIYMYIPVICALYLLLGGIWHGIIHHKFWVRVRATIALMVVMFFVPIVIFMAT